MKVTRGVIRAAAAFVLVATPWNPAFVYAWTPIHSSQPTWSDTVPYSVNERGSEDLGGYAATAALVQEGLEEWGELTCSDLQFDFRGSTSRTAGNGGAVISWLESGWQESPSAIGVTRLSFNRGRINDASTVMNGVHYEWVDGGGGGNRVDARSIALHEGGHYLGLGHSNVSGSAMFPSYGGGTLQIQGDDQLGICTLYPNREPDCALTGCPAGQQCNNGRCVDAPVIYPVCTPCTNDAMCPGRCLRYPDGQTYCGADCDSDADCGGDTCRQVSTGQSQCVRLDGTGEGDCSLPAPGGGIGGGENRCPLGQQLDATTQQCVAITGGRLGDPCDTNDQCGSELCAHAGSDSFCTMVCSTAEPCPSGFECDTGYCRPMQATVGDPCASDGECLGRLCATTAVQPFCTRVCSVDAECPAGFACEPAATGGQRICAMPDGPAGLNASPEASRLVGLSGCSARRSPVAPSHVLWWALGLGLGLWLAARRRRS